jgi:hypothetical protein
MSRNLGFMQAGGDVDGVLQQLQKDLDYRGIVSFIPFLSSLKSKTYFRRLFLDALPRPIEEAPC